MLNVTYSNRYGYYTTKAGEKTIKVWFCRANALCAEIYFYKDDDGKDMVRLYSFFADIQHLKNCAKSGLLTHYKNGITLYAKEMDNDMWKMARIFAEQGIKVTIK